MTSPKPPSQSPSKIQSRSQPVPIGLWSRRVSASLLSPIGLGLVSLGLLSGPVVQAQTTGTDIKLLEPSGLAAVQAPSLTESTKPTVAPLVAPPEIVQAEVEPMPPVATLVSQPEVRSEKMMDSGAFDSGLADGLTVATGGIGSTSD